MKRESWSIAGACLLGAFVGSLIVLEISTRFQYGHYFWSIGALLGGIVAYVGIDFRHFRFGVAYAYRKTFSGRPYGLYWRAFLAQCAVTWAFAASFLFVILLIACNGDPGKMIGTLLAIKYPSREFYFTFAILPGIVAMMSILLAFARLESRRFEQYRADSFSRLLYEGFLLEKADEAWVDAWNLNPVGVIFNIVYYASKVSWFTISNFPAIIGAIFSSIPKAVKLLHLFVTRVFIYVHSERRTICFVDASLGSAIGYFFGSSVIGAIAGATLGVINYEVVSVRWLKLASARSSTD